MDETRSGTVATGRRIDSTCDRFESAWCEYLTQQGRPSQPRLEDFLDAAADSSAVRLLIELLKLEVDYRRRLGEQPQEGDYRTRFPHVSELAIARVFSAPSAGGIDGQAAGVDAEDISPTVIGGYRIVEQIGRGGFGTVFRAHDDVLNRDVAIKISPPSYGQLVDAFIAEGRALARLRHPNVVTIYEVDTTATGQWYIVTELIDGTNLASAIAHERFDCREAANLIATIAEALHYCHTRGLVHRDIKPANILLDTHGRPYLADFGMARHGGENWFQATEGGTLAYMSPEQARGEGHLVDARSDVFSLGVVFYELLTGQRPFSGETWQETLGRLTSFDPQPPRFFKEGIPAELEQICGKAMAKRAAERYANAQQMADDIHDFLRCGERCAVAEPQVMSVDGPLPIIPKGLRSFDERDAEFFPQLVPGPRDRSGLPDTIAFWKHRIERSSDAAFRVGLLYGPSGSGKSSLVKAGLLPALSKRVCPIYVEATGDSTESTLLAELRKRFPEIAGDLTLPSTLLALRTVRQLRSGTRVLIVLDQFEQWLHSAGARAENSPLAMALRQCDGERMQCLILIRDDFWTPISRFMTHLESPLVDGQNARAADYFDPRHARRVLLGMGQAYGCLPRDGAQISGAQQAFLERAVADLARDERIAPVQIALFCELAKDKPWDLATYRAFGGAEGAGVQFLEKTFAAETAPVHFRSHLRAVLAMFEILLPEHCGDLKGPVRSRDELLEMSGYRGDPDRFAELLQILDQRLRLISPSHHDAPAGKASDNGEPPAAAHYQLTHDYLIPSLRTWLDGKRLQTRRGRAQALLEERMRHWDAQSPARYLPTLLEFLKIRLWTKSNSWTPKQRSMIRAAGRLHLLTLLIVSCLVALLGGVIVSQVRTEGVVRGLMATELLKLPQYLDKIAPLQPGTRTRLAGLALDGRLPDDERERAALAWLKFDRGRKRDERTRSDIRRFLRSRLLMADPEDNGVFCQLIGDNPAFTEHLWSVVSPSEKLSEMLPTEGLMVLNAAAALARFSPNDPRWKEAAPQVSRELSELFPFDPKWPQAMEPGKHLFTPWVIEIFSDPNSSERQHRNTFWLIVAWGQNDPALILSTLLSSDDIGAEDLLQLIVSHPNARHALDDVWAVSTRAVRRDLLALAYFRLGEYQPARELILNSTVNRAAANLLVHGLARFHCDPARVGELFEEALSNKSPDAAALLCQSLGEYSLDEVRDLFQQFDGRLRSILEDSTSDPALHSSIEWLLRKRDQQQLLDMMYESRRLDAKETIGIEDRWYINCAGQKMIILDGGTFMMGSPESEAFRQTDEDQLSVKIDRRFAISAYEITKGQYLSYDSTFTHKELKDVSPTGVHPINGVTWHEAARYCNWLSEQAGIPQHQWCYRPVRETSERIEMEVVEGYLTKIGYRLPTEAEWEFACRAGCQDPWFFGSDPSLLGHYAWYEGHPEGGRGASAVGLLKPNMFGLFDATGNVWEWVTDDGKLRELRERVLDETAERAVDKDRVEPLLDEEYIRSPDEGPEERVRRGGSFAASHIENRAANRAPRAPSDFNRINGFRVARTIAAPVPTAAHAQ